MKTKTILMGLSVGLGAAMMSGRLSGQEPKPAVPKASTVVRIELPTETATFRPGPGVEQAQTFCITCHSADYVAMQPPMPRKFWEAGVKKMKEKFGAPLPDDPTKLIDYLTATYGVK